MDLHGAPAERTAKGGFVVNGLFWRGMLALCGLFLLLFGASFLLEKFAPAKFWDKLALPLTGGARKGEGQNAKSNH